MEEKIVAILLIFLKQSTGMNPLTVTWSPHLYTDIGWKNFNWSHIGGLDNMLYTPNGVLHRLLTSLAFKKSFTSISAFYCWTKNFIGPLMAKKFGVSLIMYGENQAEYGNDIKENKSPKMNNIFFSSKKMNEIKLGVLSIKEILKL